MIRRAALSTFVVALFAAACGAPQANAPPAAMAVAPVGATPPPGADPERAKLAGSICAAAYRVSEGKVAVGCRKPPPFERAGARPDGKFLLHEGDPYTFCELSVAQRGAFTRVGAKQLLLSFDNCHDEDDSSGWNGSMPGSAVVVEEVAGRWRAVTSETNLNVGGCRAMRRLDGHDVLVCQSAHDAGNIGSLTYFFLLDFTRAAPRATTFAWLYDEADLYDCSSHGPSDPLLPDGLAGLRVAKVSFVDVNADKATDLVIDVERAYAGPSAALEGRAKAICQKNGAMKTVLPAPTSTRLEIVDVKGRFVPAPATQKLLDAWRAQSPHVTQLDGAAPPAR